MAAVVLLLGQRERWTTLRSKEQVDRGSGLGGRWPECLDVPARLRGSSGCQGIPTHSFPSAPPHRLPSLSRASQLVGFTLGQEWGHAPAGTWQVSPGSGGEFPRDPSRLQVGLLDCESWSGVEEVTGQVMCKATCLLFCLCLGFCRVTPCPA